MPNAHSFLSCLHHQGSRHLSSSSSPSFGPSNQLTLLEALHQAALAVHLLGLHHELIENLELNAPVRIEPVKDRVRQGVRFGVLLTGNPANCTDSSIKMTDNGKEQLMYLSRTYIDTALSVKPDSTPCTPASLSPPARSPAPRPWRQCGRSRLVPPGHERPASISAFALPS